MVILNLYRKLENIATNKFSDIINDSYLIYSYSGRVRKLRFKLIDSTFIDIWISFHWEQRDIRGLIYRHGNSPHKKWNNIKTYPKHCHDGTQEHVIESTISDMSEFAIKEFLSIVRKKLIEIRGSK